MANKSGPNYNVSVELSAIDQISNVVQSAMKNVSKATSHITSFNKSFSTDENFRSFKVSMKGAGEDAERAFSHMTKAAKNYFALVTGSSLAFGILGSQSYHKFKQFSEDTINLEQASNRIGISTKELRSFNYAAESVGVSSDSMTSAFERMNSMSFDFATGNLGAVAPLLDLKGGFNFTDKKGKRKGGSELFLDAADKINAIQNPTTKAQMTSQIFGDTSLLPIISLGRDGIKKLQSELNQLHIGEGFDKRATSGALGFQKVIAKTTAYLREFRNVFVAEVLPGVSESLERILGIIRSKVDVIKNGFKDLGNALPRELESAVTWFGRLGNSLEYISKKLGIVTAIFTLISFTIGVSLIKSVADLCSAIGGLWKALRVGSLFLAANPMVLAVTAVIAAITLLIVKWDWFLEKFRSGWEWVKSALPSFSSSTKQTINTQFSPPKDLLLDQIISQNIPKNNTEKNSSEVTVRFENAPAGTRITSVRGDVPTNADLGFSSVGAYAH